MWRKTVFNSSISEESPREISEETAKNDWIYASPRPPKGGIQAWVMAVDDPDLKVMIQVPSLLRIGKRPVTIVYERVT